MLKYIRRTSSFVLLVLITAILGSCKPYDSRESDKFMAKPFPNPYSDQLVKSGEKDEVEKKENVDDNEPDSEVEAKTVALLFDTADLLNQPEPNFALYTPYEDKKGVYITSNIAGIPDYLAPIIGIINDTELNAVVVDIKRDDGDVVFSGIPIADELGTTNPYIKDIKSFVSNLRGQGIYTIARIVAFRDKYLADIRPEYFARLDDGSIYRDNQTGQAWLDPFNRDYWEYLLEIAEGAAKAGFQEIQFDYIRFPTDANIKRAVFNNPDNMSKTDIITEFSEYSVKRLKKFNVKVSADVYGISIISDSDAAAIGQDYVKLSKIFDVICPMIYPSHYANDTLGVSVPDLNPYDIVYRTMALSTEKLEAEKALGAKVAVVRPWIQAFNASYLGKENVNWQRYGGKQLREQIDALYDAKVSEWLVWNASNNYTEVLDGLLPAEK